MTKHLYQMLGYPGSGKSTLAKLIANETGAVHLSSDEVRKHMFKDKEDITNPRLNP